MEVSDTPKSSELNYCCQCGSKLKRYVPAGEILERSICVKCDVIHYENPKILVGSIIDYDKKILLCKRAIKPRLGYWTLPSGYMENDETIEEAAIRETQEEAHVQVEKMHLYALFCCPNINQVYFIFRGRAMSDYSSTSVESSEVKYFEESDIPWNSLSYSIMNKSLDWYFRDTIQDQFPFRMRNVYECNPEE